MRRLLLLFVALIFATLLLGCGAIDNLDRNQHDLLDEDSTTQPAAQTDG